MMRDHGRCCRCDETSRRSSGIAEEATTRTTHPRHGTQEEGPAAGRRPPDRQRDRQTCLLVLLLPIDRGGRSPLLELDREVAAVFLDPGVVLELVARPRGLEVLLGVELVGVRDAVFHDVLEAADEALHRPRRGVAEGADRVAFDLPRELLEHGNLARVGVALLHADEQLLEPRRALAARRALPARLVAVEVREAADGGDHVDRLVHDGDRRRAEARATRLQVVEVHERFGALVDGQHGHRRAAWDDGLEVLPAAADAAAVLVDELAHRDGHFFLDDDRVVDVARDGEQLGAGVVLAAERVEPARAAAQDRRRDGDGLDVGHRRRAAEDADVRRERRLEPRLALLALERLDERRLLAADVRPRAAVQVDVVVVARPARVLAEQARRVGLVDRLVEDDGLVEVLAADVDVARARAHREPREQRALDELVRVLAHDLAVLARPGLRLVGVDHQKRRPPVRRLGHERPLEPRRKARAAAAAQPRVLDLLHDPVGPLPHELLGLVPVAALQRVREPPVLLAVQVREDACAIG
mmetsp:Transcript_9730/g.39603  ORF Transcript_9730/g.39603 Transcript_9730/m.39603 type:complete len:528 (-) Transcript_9730:20-1603(-)